MKICFFGIYDPLYARNSILISGLRANDCEIIECCVDPREYRGLSKYRELRRKAKELNKQNTFDAVFVAFPGQTVVWLARFIFNVPIIFDAFLSLYDSNVFDRKVYSKYSLRGIKDYFFDWQSVRSAHAVLLDTEAHITYFSKTFGIKK